MSALDWTILVGSLAFIVLYGLWKGRGQNDLSKYILAGNQSRWYVVAFSIMATQASAITFLSTPGQGYVDGMRFVQIYFGLPIAMVLLCMTLVPMYHRLKVFTAYEFLEKRLDLKTRVFTSVLFLIQRGLAAGFTIYAPALILSVILGWSIHITTLIMGALVIVYTFAGGSKAVSHTQFHQMIIALGGMAIAFVVIVRLIPDDVSFVDAVRVAGKSGHLQSLDFSFDLNNRYTIWSGMLGGLFLSLSYFGTDQSQVQRYLGGRSTGESRIGLLFNGLLKVPMQFFILFVGVMVFVFYQFTSPPVFFNNAEVQSVLASGKRGAYQALEEKQESLFLEKRAETYGMIKSMRSGDEARTAQSQARVQALRDSIKDVRKQAVGVLKSNNPKMSESDTNYIFLTFVTRYLPMGLLGSRACGHFRGGHVLDIRRIDGVVLHHHGGRVPAPDQEGRHGSALPRHVPDFHPRVGGLRAVLRPAGGTHGIPDRGREHHRIAFLRHHPGDFRHGFLREPGRRHGGVRGRLAVRGPGRGPVQHHIHFVSLVQRRGHDRRGRLFLSRVGPDSRGGKVGQDG